MSYPLGVQMDAEHPRSPSSSGDSVRDRIVAIIADHAARDMQPPSLIEINEALGSPSVGPSTIKFHVDRLIADGRLGRRGHYRGLYVIERRAVPRVASDAIDADPTITSK